MVFDFALMHVPWSAEAVERVVAEAEKAFAAPDLWPCWVLSNHDQPRHRTRFGGSEARARAAAVLLLTLRGTPCLYQGEELGLLDADVPAGGARRSRRPRRLARADPVGDGWHGGRPWLPFPPASPSTAEAMLALYRRLLALRPARRRSASGSWTRVASPAGTLVYDRTAGDDVRAGRRSTSRDVAVGAAAPGDGWRARPHDRRADRTWDGTLEPRRGGHPRTFLAIRS